MTRPPTTGATVSAPPFHGQTQFVATRGDDVFAIGEPASGLTTTPFAVLDSGTGKWRSLGRYPTESSADSKPQVMPAACSPSRRPMAQFNAR